MRIIAGEYGGRSIRTAEGPGYRPATAKVRQAVFSMLEARGVEWEGLRAADLFAGSGSLGIEALSRGAALAWFVDKSAQAVAALKGTMRDLGVAPARFRILHVDLFKVLNRPPATPFDLLFIDPPYGHDLLAPALAQVAAGGWLSPRGFVLAEAESRLDLSGRIPSDFIPQTDRLYGQTRIFLWRNSTQDSPSIPAPSIP